MNVYVISNVWDHSGSTVIGAAGDRPGAEQIADQRPEREELRGAWAPWIERVDPAEGSCWWERVALLADGTVHPSLSQEIVCVPLAGSDPAEVGRQVVDAIRSLVIGEPR